MTPFGAKEIVTLRRQGYRPAGGVWIFDDWDMADRAEARGFAVVKLKRREDWGSLDFRFCHGLDVSLLHHAIGTPRLTAIGQKLIEVDPRSLWVQWIHQDDRGLFAKGKFVVEPPCTS